jgi:hypothetical protein
VYRRLAIMALATFLAVGVRGLAAQTPAEPCPSEVTTYPAGWNLIAGSGVPAPVGVGPLYTLQAGDNAYESIAPASVLDPFKGYWIYFSQPTHVPFPECGTVLFDTIPLPPGQWVMVGRPFNLFGGALRGFDLLYRYNPATQTYTRDVNLTPGEGGWALSYAGGTLTFRPYATPSTCPRRRPDLRRDSRAE